MATVVRTGLVCEHCGKFLDFSYGTESAVGVLCLYCRGYVEIRDDLLVTLSMETTNMANTQHTPTPWSIAGVSLNPHEGHVIESDSADKTIAWTANSLDNNGEEYISQEDIANAEFIIRACNSYYDLLETLDILRLDLENNGEIFGTDEARITLMEEAIANAEGGD